MRPPDVDVERIEGLLRGMPPETEREAQIEGLVRHLRTSAPAAPRELRERVRELRPAERRRQFGWKPALALVPVAIALAGAALLGGDGSSTQADRDAAGGEAPSTALESRRVPEAAQDTARSGIAPPIARAQEWDVRLELAVPDNAKLSEASADAIRATRALGGYVVSSNVATQGSSGQAQLVVRIPQRRVQDAIAQLSALGTITGQEVSVQDRQADLDRLAASIDSLRVQIAQVNVRLRTELLDEAERLQLELRRQRLQRTLNALTRQRTGVAAQVAMADVSLTLRTRKAAAVGESRVDDAVDDALGVLAVAASVAVFLLIVLAPVALVTALALAARRAWRRREDERLLDRPRPTPPVGSR